MSGRGSKLFGYIDWRIRVVLSDTRSINGTLMAFDKHMNLVLSDCEEVRKIKTKGNKSADDQSGGQSSNQNEREEKRPLGLVMIRGETVIALAVLSPPKAKPKATVLAAAAAAKSAGAAVPMTAGRGIIPVTSVSAGPIGLTGPVRGVGGPAPIMSIPMPPIPPMPMAPTGMPQFMPQFPSQYPAAPGFNAQPMGRAFPAPMMPPPMPPMPQMPNMPMGRGFPPPPPGL